MWFWQQFVAFAAGAGARFRCLKSIPNISYHRLQEMIHLSISASPSTSSKVFVQKSPLEIFFFSFSAKISPVEKEHLWIPWTVFANMRHGNSWFKSDKPDGYSAKYAKGSNSSADVHPGSEIVIEYARDMIVELMCEYHMFWYPFECQTSAELRFIKRRSDQVRLIPNAVCYLLWSKATDLIQLS